MSDYQDVFEAYIASVKKALMEGDYILAEERIKEAMNKHPHSPMVHNLYGILEELLKEDNLAHKHYRAAYALDPTYRPAIRNLERIAAFNTRKNKMHIDFGDESAEEEDDLYMIEYDKNHVGHLWKKERK